MTLYEIAEEYRIALEVAYHMAEVSEGEVSEEISNRLDELQMPLLEKVRNTANAYKNILAEADAIEAEKKNLAKREASLRNRAKGLKNYMQYCINEGEEFSFPTASVKWTKSTAIEITNPECVPASYCKVTIEPMKKLIKEASKTLDISAFAKIVERKNLSIK